MVRFLDPEIVEKVDKSYILFSLYASAHFSHFWGLHLDILMLVSFGTLTGAWWTPDFLYSYLNIRYLAQDIQRFKYI